MPRINGPVLDIEQVPAYNGADGQSRPPFLRLHVLDGITVAQVNAKDFHGSLPNVGDTVDLDVSVTAYPGRGGTPAVSFGLRKVLSANGAHKAA